MITHKNSMTPRAKRRKAVTEAVRQATLVSCNSEMWHQQFERTLERAGYRVVKMTALERQRAAADATAFDEVRLATAVS